MKSLTVLQGFLIILMTFASCTKEKISTDSNCKRDCQNVRLSGQLLDVSTNTGISNTEIKAHFYQYKSTCYFCFGTPVETFAKTITDNLGRFSFDIIVDTVALNGSYHYAISVYAAVNYFYLAGNNKTFYNYPNNFSNIILSKFKKTTLAVKFKRDSADNFNQYVVTHTFRDTYSNRIFEPNPSGYVFIKPYSINIADTTVNIVTAANFWTNINSRKFSINSTLSIYSDSVFCTVNGPNNLTVKY